MLQGPDAEFTSELRALFKQAAPQGLDAASLLQALLLSENNEVVEPCHNTMLVNNTLIDAISASFASMCPATMHTILNSPQHTDL